ncbi:MAG TPA: penicillin-insensitive murein endopeptidase [Thiobacillaceae bacterium]
MRARSILAAGALALLAAGAASAAGSRCYGTVGNGRIEGSVKLPTRGSNFEAYSVLGAAAGRTYVHSRVSDVLLAAYAELARTHPGKKYVYGETGWAGGGRFRPHRTHQNGLSVDFFVPVVDANGKSAVLPIVPTNKLGYDIEFDASGRFGQYAIDFEALAEHLYQLDVAARTRGIGIAMVILDREYLPKLFSTARGRYLREKIPFMKGKPWVRHDEHYHVDFAVRCMRNRQNG